MNGPGPLSERALVLAPTGRDADIAALILGEAGLEADIRKELMSLCEEISRGAALAVIANEAVRDADLRPLVDVLTKQPPWSDFPIILLTLAWSWT